MVGEVLAEEVLALPYGEVRATKTRRLEVSA
jgi:hypothetical protein